MSEVPPQRAVWPRLVGEFLVIVVGVLVALAVDSWVGAAADRRLEREYLERLLVDVESDLVQYDFVADVSAAGTAYVDSLLSPGLITELEPDRLVGAVFVASRERHPNPVRPTFQELVSSGRIGVIRSRRVRTALVEYEEAITQTERFWDELSSPLGAWVRSRVPPPIERAWANACGEVRPVADRIAQAMVACRFDLGDWDAAELRRDLQTSEARSHLTNHWWRHYYGRGIVGAVREAALDLRTALKTELGEDPAS